MIRKIRVKLNLSRLKGFFDTLTSPHSLNKRRMYMQWRARYVGFTRRRFSKFSKGGGDWPKLAPSTVAGRRKGGKKRGGVNKVRVKIRKTGGKVAILRVTNTLFNQMDVSKSDNYRFVHNGIRVGYLSHDKAMQQEGTREIPGNLTVEELANIHHQGTDKIPPRQIIVQPDKQTVDGMIRDARHMVRGQIRTFGRSI